MYACLFCCLNTDTDTPAFQNGDVRLVNANDNTNMSGRLEVYYRGRWGTVCHDRFNNNAALVVCRQLGFNPFSAIAIQYAFFGQGVGPIWLDNVNCNGFEPNIDSCRHNPWGINNCRHYKDVSVVCHGKLIYHIHICIHTYVQVWHYSFDPCFGFCYIRM